MNSQSKTPCKNGRQPTVRSIFAESPAPIRNSVIVRPVVAICPNTGAIPAIPGTKLRATEARQETAYKPRHLHLGLMLRHSLAVSLARSEDGRCAQGQWYNPERTREFNGRSRVQSIQAVMGARANH